MSRHPMVKWAQRSDRLFITVELPDANNVTHKLEPEGKFLFSATTGVDNTPYEVEFDLFDKVDVNESKISATSRNICYLVKKAENKWWTRLLKQSGKPPIFLKVDWDKWVDEDEQDEKVGSDMDFGDFDFSVSIKLEYVMSDSSIVFLDINLLPYVQKLNMGGGGDFDADIADRDEGDDDSDTEDEIKEEGAAASGEPHTAPASSESETKA
nr:co-chaperone protein p23-1-like isoform X1 [Coffea arabica]